MREPAQRKSSASFAEALRDLKLGREAYARRAWGDAYRSLSIADVAAPLGVDDLELLAMSAYLIGRDSDYLSALDRAHHAYLDANERLRAVRCAFWLGLRLAFRGETGPATGWFGRAQRLLERDARDCVEQGYLLLPLAEQNLAAANSDAAYATATSAAEIGERFGDADLIACARHLQGRSLIQQGQVEAGLALLDEAMVAATAGELSPIMTGLIYCSVIDNCQRVYALARAREWTSALARWCADQPQLVSFTRTCLVHRAEIMQLHGAWPDAIEEARRACTPFSEQSEQQPPAAAFYQQAELQRLRGEFKAAEESYQSASARGYEPQPGLALLRMAQGRLDVAVAAIRRVAPAVTDQLRRTRLLPAYIEIMLAAGETEEARSACRELDETAETYNIDVLSAIAAHSRGALKLTEGDAGAALASLRHAFQVWQQVDAPYLTARVRELMGLACRTLGDVDGAALELEAARVAFERLGAGPDRARVSSLLKGAPGVRAYGLTPRELQVLRLVAAGKTNKAIASELFVSRRTVDRHVSNLFGKLYVASRVAATNYAYKHKLV